MFKIILSLSFLYNGVPQQGELTLNPENVPKEIVTCEQLMKEEDYKAFRDSIVTHMGYWGYTEVKIEKEECSVSNV